MGAYGGPVRRGFWPAILIAALLALAPAAHAAGPRWSQGQLLAYDATAQALGVGVDAAGTVTTLSGEGGRLVGRLRRPGGALSGPVDLGPLPAADAAAATSWPPAKLAVADSGEVVLVHTDRRCPPGPEPCGEPLYVRAGPSIAELSPPQLLTEDGSNPSVAISAGGHVLVGWRSIRRVGQCRLARAGRRGWPSRASRSAGRPDARTGRRPPST